MSKLSSTIKVLIVLILLFRAASAQSESICAPDGLQSSGSIYRICMPPAAEYNGSLVVWAHGFQDAGTPVEIPEDQLSFGDFSLPEIINTLGFGFATNSYSKTGLAILQGMDDILDLVEIYADKQGAPENVYVVGASEGGIITALLVEQHPSVFKAGLAACGPVGDFPYQINYFGDARATFQYFFPGLIPGDPFQPSQELIDNWANYYDTVVKSAVLHPSNRSKLDQWVRVAHLPFDDNNYLETVEESVRDVLRYSVVNVNDAAATLGGFPFDNHDRLYFGSNNDLFLNIFVPRRSADPAAITEMKTFYNTSGQLQNPVITLHTLRDQQVPYPHEFFYALKTFFAGNFLVKHLNIPIDRYGHCNFTPQEALAAFGIMLIYANDMDVLNGVGSVLEDHQLPAFENLARKYQIPYTIEGGALKALKKP
ncbi:MAG: alpha/beta hydrolase family protein [Planctomycetota bacterium]|jgi:pimeloyl-ACP methyl ester carboxylesterase